jgi:hypothetical protein
VKHWSTRGSFYVAPWGFSLNESAFPNIHMSWDWGFYFYIAFTKKYKASFLFGKWRWKMVRSDNIWWERPAKPCPLPPFSNS